MRELVWMMDGRARLEWAQTAALLAQQYNLHRGKEPAKGPEDFDPYTARERAEQEREARAKAWLPITVLKAFLPKG